MGQVKNKIRRLIVLGLLFTLVIGISPDKIMAASAAKPKLKSTSMRIWKGQSQKIGIVNVKSEQIKNVTYSSSKKSVAKVSKNGVNFKMVYVEAGTFTMGSNSKNADYSESPMHKVTLTKDFLMGETEVTEALWNAVMGNGNSSKTMPKTSVTWTEAHTFVDKLNQIAHKKNLIEKNQNFILPTEAQWEYAAKGGKLSKNYKYSGSNKIDDVAQTLENTGSNSPVAVKGKMPNELGLYDMSGNAYEWVDDYAGSYSAKSQVNPQNTTPSGTYVKRGGSNYHRFSSEPYLFTTTGRYFYGSTDWTIGFRIVLAEK